MTGATQRRGRRPRHAVLLCGCGLAAMLAAGAAQAQSLPPGKGFMGTPTVAAGDISISRSGTSDTIFIDAGGVGVIDWTPDSPATSGVIDFLPSDHSALFTSGGFSTAAVGPGDFTVLNRILPTGGNVPISLNGTIAARATPSGPTAGSVWFYSPGGILVGSTAQIDVGGLVLTTNDIDTTGGLFGPDGQIRFRGASGSTAAVTVADGARISGADDGSYLAIVAPKIVQSGSVSVNGAVAYVAAEAADVTIQNGLFSIGFVTGTSVAEAITHTGSTTGAAQAGGYHHGVYVAAMPKNDAVTMLVSGQLGYAAASSASTAANGDIILSAGYDIAYGFPALDHSGGAADFVLGDATITSPLHGYASRDASLRPSAGGTFSASGSVDLHGGRSATVRSSAGGLIEVGGGLVVEATSGAQGGAALVSTNGGDIDAATLFVTADGYGPSSDGVAGIGQGGQARVLADGGAITVGGLSVSALGQGGYGPNGGEGRGGTAELIADNGRIEVRGDIDISAVGLGGDSYLTGSGGAGVGGDVRVSTSGAGASLAFASLSARADGSAIWSESRPLVGGSGRGGTAQANFSGGQVSGGDVQIEAVGYGGDGGVTDSQAGYGGTGDGGSAQVRVDGATVEIAGLTIGARGVGGGAGIAAEGSPFGPATGGAGRGGTAGLTVTAGALTTAAIDVQALGLGGTGAAGGAGGLGAGGAATALVSGGSLAADGLTLGGQGYGAAGAAAEAGLDGGRGGDGLGGQAAFTYSGGTLGLASLSLSGVGGGGAGGDSGDSGSTAATGAGGRGGDAQGGGAEIGLAAVSPALQTVFAYASAIAGDGGAGATGGAGGQAVGGQASVTASAPGVALAGATLQAHGDGGAGGVGRAGAGGAGGAGTGGALLAQAQGLSPSSTFTLSSLSLDASGDGGAGAAGGAGGASTGGSVDLAADAATLRLTSALELDLAGGGAAAGARRGGDFTSTATAGGGVELAALSVSTIGDGAPGADGQVAFAASGAGSTRVLGDLRIDAGDIGVSHAGQPGGVDTLRAGSIQASASGAVTAGDGAVIRSDGAMSIFASGDLGLDRAYAIGDIDLYGGEAVTVRADLASAGQVRASGRGVALNALGGLAVGFASAYDGDVDIAAAGDLAVQSAYAAGDIRLASTAGSVTVGELTTNSMSSLALSPNVGAPGPGDITITAAQDANLLEDVTARRHLTVSAGDNIRIAALADGREIRLSSADIDIGAEARVGAAGFTTLTLLTDAGAQPAFVGGEGAGDGYSLDAGELGRVRAEAVTIEAPGAGASGDVTLADLSFAGARQFTVDAARDIVIAGAAAFQVSSDGAVALNAGRRISLDPAAGSVVLSDGDGGLSGTLSLSAPHIVAVGAEALADISAPDATIATRNLRLGQNDGAVNEGGYFQAGGLRFAVREALYIQNSGGGTGFDQRRGFTFGAGGLDISPFEGGSPEIVVNGRGPGEAGGFVTGLDVLPLLTVNGQAPADAGLDRGSTLNGCLIFAAAGCTLGDRPPPVQDVVALVSRPDDPDADSGQNVLRAPRTLVELAGFRAQSVLPMIDEPVTGVGADGLWREGGK